MDCSLFSTDHLGVIPAENDVAISVQKFLVIWQSLELFSEEPVQMYTNPFHVRKDVSQKAFISLADTASPIFHFGLAEVKYQSCDPSEFQQKKFYQPHNTLHRNPKPGPDVEFGRRMLPCERYQGIFVKCLRQWEPISALPMKFEEVPFSGTVLSCIAFSSAMLLKYATQINLTWLEPQDTTLSCCSITESFGQTVMFVMLFFFSKFV